MQRKRIGTTALLAAMLLIAMAVPSLKVAQQRAPQPAQPAQPSPQRGQTAAQPAAQRGQQIPRPARIGGHPNLNGIWQALNTANWNLEAHPLEALSQFSQLGAIAAIPAGKSVIKGGGKIPYRPEALKQRDENRAKWPASDNEAKCYMLGIPRYTYHNLPFQISQGDDVIMMVYPFAAGYRRIYLKDHSRDPVDSWMGRSNGHWEGDVLVIETTDMNDSTMLDRAGNFHSNQLKVTEKFRLVDSTHIMYEATLQDPQTYIAPWTIEMPLYRLIDENAQILENKCVPFADMILYGDLIGNKKP